MFNSIYTIRVQCGTREVESKVTLSKVVNYDSATMPKYREDSAVNSTGDFPGNPYVMARLVSSNPS